MEEIFKDVIGYEDYYMVSNLGAFFSKRTNRLVKICVHKKGYANIATRFGGKKGKTKCFKVHREVAKAFIPNPENKPTVNHKDGNKLNNNVNNLEWATHKEQMRHCADSKLQQPLRGERNGFAKFTTEQINEIRRSHKKYDRENGTFALSRKYSINRKTMEAIVRNKSYVV